MGLLNYTTKIPAEKTISEIEKMLAKSGAEKILKDYDGAGNVSFISFMIKTGQGTMPIKLPMNVKAVMQIINNQTNERTKHGARVVPMSMHNDMDQARKVGWRIIKDWLEAQLALFFLQMVKIEEIFLPYVFNSLTNKTLFQHIEEKGFGEYILEDKSDEQENR